MNLKTSFAISTKAYLQRKLSKRVKRYILLVSLWSFYKNVDEIDKATLRKLNDLLALQSNEGSLYIPAMLGRLIWKDGLGNVVKTIDIKEYTDVYKYEPNLVQKTLDNIPAWLSYDRREIIRQDIELLVSELAIT